MNSKIIEYYKKKGRFVVDCLPKEVSKDQKAYADVLDEMFLSDKDLFGEREKIKRLLVKLLIYFDFDIYGDDGDCLNLKSPRELLKYMEDDRNHLKIHLEKEASFIDWDLSKLSFEIYNPSAGIKDILLPLVKSEGLFYRKA